MTTIGEKITNAMANITTLNIVTKVKGANTEKLMQTEIDLVEGDITNTLHQDFITGDLKEVRAFHEQQVANGQQIIKDNIAALKALWELVVTAEVKDKTVKDKTVKDKPST